MPAVAKDRGKTYNFGYIGSRATGFTPGNYLVVGPDCSLRRAGRSSMYDSVSAINAAVEIV